MVAYNISILAEGLHFGALVNTQTGLFLFAGSKLYMGDADIITEQDCCIVPYREKSSCSASTTDGWMSRINNTQVYIS